MNKETSTKNEDLANLSADEILHKYDGELIYVNTHLLCLMGGEGSDELLINLDKIKSSELNSASLNLESLSATEMLAKLTAININMISQAISQKYADDNLLDNDEKVKIQINLIKHLRKMARFA